MGHPDMHDTTMTESISCPDAGDAPRPLSAASQQAGARRGMGGVYLPTYRDDRTGERRQSTIWWVQYSHRGKKFYESSQSRSRSVALRLLRKRLGEIAQGRLVGPDVERTTFADLATMLVDDYVINRRKSLKTAQASIKRLREFFGEARAVEITADRVAAYIRARQEGAQGAMPSTVANELAALKRMFNLGLRAGRVVQRPYIPTLKLTNVRQGFFEEPEYRAVLEHLPEHLRPLVILLFTTGWRIGEALPLTWKQVDFQAGIVRLEPGTTKNDEGRVFPFAALPALAEMLREQRERTLALSKVRNELIPWVFHRDGKPLRDFRDSWRNACTAAGLAGRIPHDFRRTAVRNLERAGVPRSVAMKLTGHKTEAVYRRYAIVSEADLSQGVAKLAVLHAAQTSGPRTIIPIQSHAV